MGIEIQHLHKKFGGFIALEDVSLSIPAGQLTALLGPSGCGKTTLLRIIAGLEPPDRGAVLFGGIDATVSHVRERRVGFVFQHYALFRHMSVYDNIAFGLEVKPRSDRPSRSEIRDRVMRLLQLVQLENQANRFPAQLSGGQRQRVALARALAVEPKVLLLDEPFGALDAKVRQELRRWLRRLHDEIHVTSVFVTHDQEEALEVADQVVVMERGRVEQVGTPQDVWDRPATPFVYNFLGSVNLFHGRADGNHMHLAHLRIPLETDIVQESGEVLAFVRPHELEVRREGGADERMMRVCLRHAYAAGAVMRLDLERCDTGEGLTAELSRDEFSVLGCSRGDMLFVRPKNVQVFAK